MPIKIGAGTRIGPYTRKDIMQAHHSDLWARAECVASSLLDLQKELVGMLPDAKRLLPGNLEELKDEVAQGNFLNYIKLRSLYFLSKKMWNVVDKQCRQLAEANDNDDIEDAKNALEKTLSVVETIPSDRLINDPECGLLKLDEIKKQFKPDNIDTEVLIPYGMFSDIVGEYQFGKLMCEKWLELAIRNEDPSAPSIGQLLDDDQLIRIY